MLLRESVTIILIPFALPWINHLTSLRPFEKKLFVKYELHSVSENTQ